MSLEDLEEDGRRKRSVKSIIYDREILFNLLVKNIGCLKPPGKLL